MEKFQAIPNGYMTVGTLAKKMHTTVRTLQYYDKEGLFPPSTVSEGGRRLYSDKDVIRLHQIQSLKYLGFSLEDIKNRLVILETPQDVAKVFDEQRQMLREKITALTDVLQTVEKLKIETLQMETIDWSKYADIVVNLQMKNEFYWMIKYFDDDIMNHLRRHFNLESALPILDTLNRLLDEAAVLQHCQIPPESEQGQALAQEWWEMVIEFTGNDMSLLPNLMKVTESMESWDEGWKQKCILIDGYIKQALEIYFSNSSYEFNMEAADDSDE